MKSLFWTRLVPLLVLIKLLAGLVAYFATFRHFDTLEGDSAFPYVLHLLFTLPFAAAGLLLMRGGREDERAVALGGFFLTASTAYCNRPLRMLAQMGGPDVGFAAMVIDAFELDAFMAFYLWVFVRDFPDQTISPWSRRITDSAIRVSVVVGVLFFFLNLLQLAVKLSVTGPGWWEALRQFVPQRGGGLYYGLVMPLAAAAFPFMWWKARSCEEPDRRRVRLFLESLVIGFTPLILIALAGMIWREGYTAFRLEHPDWARALVLGGGIFALAVPALMTYAVLVHRVLGVKLIARRALRYALARYSAMALGTVPLIAVIGYLYYHREESLQSLLSGRRFLLLLSASAVGWLALRYRGALLEAVDRRFFREQYDARQILTRLVERIRATNDVASLASLLAREIDLALHLEEISLLVLDPRSGALGDPSKRFRRLDSSSELVNLVSSTSDPVSTDLEDPRSPLATLPEQDRHWLVDSGFKLLVPILARDGSLLGVLGLGAKKSGLPFLREDRQLLHAVASNAAWVIELAQLHSTGPRRIPRGTDLEEIDSTLPAADLAKECSNCGRLYPSYTVFCNQCSRRLEPSHVPYVLPGKFRFERRIGSGGMGVVYRGADLALGRPVAVKTLRRVSPEDAMRLRREARTAAAVSHRHLAPVYGMETWHGTPMLVLELLEGGTLAQRIEKGPLSPLETVDLGIAMAEALAQLHASDILHRDIKPSNIGYTRDNVPKLMDFGIARVAFDLRRDQILGSLAVEDDLLPPTGVWNQSPSSISLSKQLVGTLSYLSPEALNGETPDASFDLWGLSIVLYECMLGRKVFTGADAKQIMTRIKLGRVPEPGQVLPDCDEALGELFRLALHKTPSRRPSTALELKQRLETVRERLRLVPLPDPPRRGRPHPDSSLR
ncbi:MAG TPA: serine/threonine-protein kinase [Thermoanaerobaculia bacterium]